MKLQIETSNDAHLLKPWPCSSWVGFGLFGLGLLGLGPHFLKRSIRRTLDVFGPCPFLLLMRSLFAC